MPYAVIHGGKKLHGSLPVQSNKNSAMAILFASHMIKGKTKLVDVPDIDDVDQVLRLITSIGARVDQSARRTVIIDASGPLYLNRIDHKVAKSIRTSLLLWGALAKREKKYTIPKSGGCHLGERSVRPHWYALEKFGVTVASSSSKYIVNNQPLKAANIVMYESGDTTTENAVMAGVLAPGVTTIKMASANYQVQDLCYFLNAAGARISGIGTTTLTIRGVKALHAPGEAYPIMPDPIAAMTLLAAGIFLLHE